MWCFNSKVKACVQDAGSGQSEFYLPMFEVGKWSLFGGGGGGEQESL